MRRSLGGALLGVGLVVASGATVALGLATLAGLEPPPETLLPPRPAARVQILDRHGEPLLVTYANHWNLHDRVALHEVPPFLVAAFVAAEDRRFFEHRGVDWMARARALVQNLGAGRRVSGASTLTEQVVRILHPRPRTYWSRWLEGIEARRLERRFGKEEILEFYFDQVPYARQRRGVVQAARDYFDRDLDTLSAKEMLALAVLVRSPSRLDPRRPAAVADLEPRIERLAARLAADGALDRSAAGAVESSRIELQAGTLPVAVPHFVDYTRRRLATLESPPNRVRTTLDSALERRCQEILERRLAALADLGAGDGAVLVVDHRRDEILAWVNGGGFSAAIPGSQIDAVLTPRQPGSTLKPFLYALALERGWTAATVIDDLPLSQAVGRGLHRYRNYSRRFYGPLRLREALGNSLNVPAVRTIQEVGPGRFHELLDELGFASLDRHPGIYGEGLALGNGEVTLLELVGAYATLARAGVWRPLRVLPAELSTATADRRRVFTPEVSSLVADILADPDARRREFGSGGILEMPAPTAVKTGTSNDYRDAWAVGFTERYTVGVWVGNLDRRAMEGVSGAVGPALVLRSVLAELNRQEASGRLFLSRSLVRTPVCRVSGARAAKDCPSMEEWFRPGGRPAVECPLHGEGATALPAVARPRLSQPTPGLMLARDPRIPDALEAFPFEVDGASPGRVEWLVDGEVVAHTAAGERRFLWPLAAGAHWVQARVWPAGGGGPLPTEVVPFVVR